MRIRIFYFFIALLFTATFSFANEYHVSKKGDDENDGSLKRPFNTISKAVYYAYPGDTITIHTGVYREWVNPIRGGESDINRIVYRAAPGEKVEIKGSEIISGWEKVRKGVWKVTLPNSFFGGGGWSVGLEPKPRPGVASGLTLAMNDHKHRRSRSSGAKTN